ncbi:MAG TPA: MFS transporter [Bacillota bacterium]
MPNHSWLLHLALSRYLAFVTRLNVVPFYPELMERFGVTYAGAGALYTAFFVGYALSLIPAGAAADRGRPARQLAVGLAVAGAAGAVLSLTGSFAAALAARVVQGLAVALMYTAVLKVVAVEFSQQHRGRAVGLMEQATGLGMLTALTFAPLLSTWVAARWLLLSQAGMCALALILLLQAPPTRPGRPTAPGAAATRPGPGEARPLPPLRNLFGRDLALITLTVMLGLFAANGLLAWLPAHLVDGLGHSKAAAGLITGLILAGQVLGVYPAGTLSDRLGRRLPVVHAGTALLIAGFTGLLVVQGGWALYVLAVILGVGMAWAVTPMVILSTEFFGPERAGLASSITIAFGQAAAGLTGVVFGWVLDQTGNFNAIWISAALVAALRFPGMLAIREQRKWAEPPDHPAGTPRAGA